MQYIDIFTYKKRFRIFLIMCRLGCHTITMVAVRNQKAHKGPWEIWGSYCMKRIFREVCLCRFIKTLLCNVELTGAVKYL